MACYQEGGTPCLVRQGAGPPAPTPLVGRQLWPADPWSGWEAAQGPLGLFHLESANAP